MGGKGIEVWACVFILKFRDWFIRRGRKLHLSVSLPFYSFMLYSNKGNWCPPFLVSHFPFKFPSKQTANLRWFGNLFAYLFRSYPCFFLIIVMHMPLVRIEYCCYQSLGLADKANHYALLLCFLSGSYRFKTSKLRDNCFIYAYVNKLKLVWVQSAELPPYSLRPTSVYKVWLFW